MSENRFQELEIRIAYQDDLIEKLNQALQNQQLRIDNLELALKNAKSAIEEVQSAAPGSSPGNLIDEKPPHY